MILFITGRLCAGLPITGGYFWAEGAGDVTGALGLSLNLQGAGFSFVNTTNYPGWSHWLPTDLWSDTETATWELSGGGDLIIGGVSYTDVTYTGRLQTMTRRPVRHVGPPPNPSWPHTQYSPIFTIGPGAMMTFTSSTYDEIGTVSLAGAGHAFFYGEHQYEGDFVAYGMIFQFSPAETAIPEPATTWSVCIGLAGGLALTRRKA